jgi:hypothetical protein
MGMDGTLCMYQAVATLIALSFLSFGLSSASGLMKVSLHCRQTKSAEIITWVMSNDLAWEGPQVS